MEIVILFRVKKNCKEKLRFRRLSATPAHLTTESILLKYEGVVAPEIPDAWITASMEKLMFTAWECIQSGDIAMKDAPDLVLRTFLKGNAPMDYGRLKKPGVDEDAESGKGDLK